MSGLIFGIGLGGFVDAQVRGRVTVSVLDPDLASMQSMSLSVRMEMQKDRTARMLIDRERTWLERLIRGEEE